MPKLTSEVRLGMAVYSTHLNHLSVKLRRREPVLKKFDQSKWVIPY